MIAQNVLEAEAVRQAAVGVVSRHLSPKVHGYKCNREMLVNVMLKAASQHTSIEAACAELAEVADSNTLREQINRVFSVAELGQQEAAMNQALVEELPADITQRIIHLAMDTHDEPCYGKRPELVAYSCRGQAKAGTTHFIRVASVYLIWRGVRLTLAVAYVKPADALVDVVARLLKRIRALGIRWSVLYMDKGFCSSAIIRYLDTTHQAAIIACPIRGKQGGIRALCRGSKAYTTDYTFSDGTTARLALYPARVRDKAGKRRCQWLVYVLVHLGWLAQEAFLAYRRRFGIEASYRLARSGKAFTTSRNPALHFFFVALGLLLQNIWIYLRNAVARRPGAGPRRIAPLHFPFRQFLHFLAHAIEQTFGVVLRCPFLRFSKSVIY